MSEPLQLLLIADSSPFHGPDGRLPLSDARMYPNLLTAAVREEIDRDVEITFVCRAGLSSRDAMQIVSKDIGLQESVLPHTDVILFAGASSDALPVGLPTWVKDLIPSISHAGTRRWAREAYWKYHSSLVKLTGGRMRYVPRSVSIDLWERIIDLLRFHSLGAPVIALGIQPSRGEHHGSMDPHSRSLNEDIRVLALRKDVPLVPIYDLCESRVESWNADGLHWDYETHAAVAALLTEPVVEAARAGKHAPWAALLEGEIAKAKQSVRY